MAQQATANDESIFIEFIITVGNKTKSFKIRKSNINLNRVKTEINALFPSISSKHWVLVDDKETVITNKLLDATNDINEYKLNVQIVDTKEDVSTDESDEDEIDAYESPIIIDTGSYSTKFGFAHDMSMLSQIASKVGRPRHKGVMVGMAQKDCYVGGSRPNIGFSVGGAKDVNNFREAFAQNIVPKASSISYTGIFYDYYFETTNDPKPKQIETKQSNEDSNNDMIDDEKQKKEPNKTNELEYEGDLFYPSYCYAKCKPMQCLFDDEKEYESEYWITCGLNSNIKESDFKRNTLNLVIVLDISGSMSSNFSGGGSNKTKMTVANECLCGLLDHLSDEDRFALVLFDTEAIVFENISKIKDIDVDNLKQRIKSEIRTRGGTDLECGYLKAKQILDSIDVTEDDIMRSSRIIYLTDMNPNRGITDKNGLLGLTKKYVSKNIFSTFIGIGIDFNTDLVSYISNVSGCNYYAVKSEKDFIKRMDTEFEFMVTPLVFDLKLRLKSEGNSCCIQNVFGSGDDSNKIKQDENESLNYEVMNVKTLFPSKQENGRTKGGIILIQIKKNGDNNNKQNDSLDFEIEVSYKDKVNKEHKNEQSVSFGGKENTKENDEHFDNLGIRKGILLTRFVGLIKEWILNDDNEEKPLAISAEYKQKFTQFAKYFESEMAAINDDSLEKEYNILLTLSGLESDESIESKSKKNKQPKKIYEYNENGGAGYYYSAKSGILAMKYPIENGFVNDFNGWDDAEKIWHNVFYNELRVAPEEHLVIMIERYNNPKSCREKTTQIMFETFAVPCFYLTNTLFLNMYACGRQTGVCIDIGMRDTFIAPVHGGCVLSNALVRLNVGGGHITNYLIELLMKKGHSFTTSMEKEIVRDIKEQIAFVHDGMSEEKESFVEYKLPTNDALISIGDERWRCCELLFDPKSTIGVEENGIDKCIFDAVMKCSEDLREGMFSNIVLCGGSSVLPGLGQRIVNGLKKLVSDMMDVQIANTSNHQKQNGVFIGAGLLCQDEEFLAGCFSIDEYDENGPAYIHKKCVRQ